MRLTDANAAIRPRSAWEALDLGVLLARRDAGLLIASWAVLTLPLFVLLSLLLWQSPSWALLLFWWLKPAFERLPLHILSRSLFGDRPSLAGALRALPALLKPQLLASLTWRRLSPTRSFDLPVLQLEGLSGAARSQRLVVLGQRDTGVASWLTVVGMHIETALWLGLLALLYLLLPAQLAIDWQWQDLLDVNSANWLWLEHLSNLLYVLVLCVWEPVYVACGFSLYLNRRTTLEAWDIELQFRRLRQRLGGSAAALLLGVALLLAQLPAPLWAADSASSCPLPFDDPLGPDKPRLQHQALSSAAAREQIATLLDQPPFENRESVTRWRLGDAAAGQAQPAADGSLLQGLKNLLRLLAQLGSLEWLARLLEALLWSGLFCLLALLAWRYREWLQTFGHRLRRSAGQAGATPALLFGLQVAPASLPADIPGSAERLWASQPREALGLLYRGLLSRLLEDFRLPLKSSSTENEVLQLVSQLDQPQLSQYSLQLTRHWQGLAYGHRLPPAAVGQQLCRDWRELFAGEHGA
ncbi:DUF4129 domain-containing protein [Pseudomonas sp. N040]|uniref:DUF4129 domain-containing protein n=1 Tax=Pseudomonas sp. N040 TaxID=2785325 RepID=UPI0018A296FA|nr:DUF4129 domain-containing protein [Pseudomonas sp. N040]MBF7729813.1 DUF4129 domain-containing protein [Pseudomonas sp. N040]MBW7013455.1 DUF4129 domain-containing protein [Pseudomonas sp. N040]